MKKTQLLIACILWSTAVSVAQSKLSLEECVYTAINNNLSIKQTEITQGKYQASYEQSKLQQYPSLNANTGHNLNFGRSLDFTTYQFTTEAIQTNNLGVNAQATLFNGGRLRNNIQLQEKYIEKGVKDLKAQKDDIAINVAARFVDVLYRKEQLKIAEKQYELRKQDLDRTLKLIENGVSAASARYDLEAQFANAEFQVTQAENSLENGLFLLKQAMNLPLEQEIDIVIPSAGIPTLDDLEALNPEVVYNAALLNQGGIQSASKNEEIAALNIKLAESSKYPTITLGGNLNSYQSSAGTEVIGFETSSFNVPVQGLTTNEEPFVQFINQNPLQEDSPFFTQLSDNFTQAVGLSVNIPIFNQGQVKNQIQQAEFDLQAAQLNTKLEKQTLRQEIESAYIDAKLAYSQYESSLVQLEAQEKAAEIAKKRYDLGAGSVYDYFTAQNNIATAEIQASQAKFDFIYKVKILEFYKENNYTF